MSDGRIAVVMDTVAQERALDRSGWTALRALGHVVRCTHPRPIRPEELSALLADADVALTGWGTMRLDEAIVLPRPTESPRRCWPGSARFRRGGPARRVQTT